MHGVYVEKKGLLIMALKKCCPKCGRIIDYSAKYCDECSKNVAKSKKDNNRYYDKNLRNKESTKVYHSKEWDMLTEQCKSRFKGLDIYSYYVLGKIECGSICHHIEEITNNKERIYDLENLIYLSNGNHNVVHSLYKKDYEGTMKMLFELVDRWKKEMNV